VTLTPIHSGSEPAPEPDAAASAVLHVFISFASTDVDPRIVPWSRRAVGTALLDSIATLNRRRATWAPSRTP
jgi:hypothetical protein